jgi:hypothetical protein
MHKVVPVAGIADLERTRDELITQTEVRCLLRFFFSFGDANGREFSYTR